MITYCTDFYFGNFENSFVSTSSEILESDALGMNTIIILDILLLEFSTYILIVKELEETFNSDIFVCLPLLGIFIKDQWHCRLTHKDPPANFTCLNDSNPYKFSATLICYYTEFSFEVYNSFQGQVA